MKYITLSFLLINFFCEINSQVNEINWKLDHEIYLKLSNDSNYTYDIREAFHVNKSNENFNTDFVFYPVNPGPEFIEGIPQNSISDESFTTLWSSLHAKIGGGWIHFINCLAYALETKKLDLTKPLMVRPVSKWRPDPITETYLRTKDWKYYIPLEQKLAQKEYNTRLAANELGDIKSLPQSYIDLFLSTNQKKYNKLVADNNYSALAKIDLVKLLLGANYLGEAQISYISNAVLEAVQLYSTNMLPSVIIFDEYDAAAAMSLDAEGYKIETIAYRTSANISEEEALRRSEEIKQIVLKINEYNKNSFQKRLINYYRN
jgi:hypothetical protein